MTRKLDPNRLAHWIIKYHANLADCVRDYSTDYCYPVEHVPVVVNKMRMAIERGSYSKEGRAFKRTCKQLGIKHTYKAIEEYLTGGSND